MPGNKHLYVHGLVMLGHLIMYTVYTNKFTSGKLKIPQVVHFTTMSTMVNHAWYNISRYLPLSNNIKVSKI